MKKLAKAYKMLKTCNIKSGNLHVVHEEFEAGKTYATKDIIAACPILPELKNKDGSVKRKAKADDRRVWVWIEQGFCIPAGEGAEIATVATPEEKVDAKQEAEEKRAKKAAEAADAKAGKEAAKLEAADLKAEAKAAKEETAELKKQAADEKKEKAKAEKAEAAEKALQVKEDKKLAKLWKDVPAEDYPKCMALLAEQGYEFEDDIPTPDDPEAWLAYFVPFFGEDGPPDLSEAE